MTMTPTLHMSRPEVMCRPKILSSLGSKCDVQRNGGWYLAVVMSLGIAASSMLSISFPGSPCSLNSPTNKPAKPACMAAMVSLVLSSGSMFALAPSKSMRTAMHVLASRSTWMIKFSGFTSQCTMPAL